MNNQVKLIEVIQQRIEQLPPFNLTRYEQGKKEAYENVIAMLTLEGELHTPPVPTIKPGDKVRHDDWGDGVVYDLDEDDSAIAIVDFDDEGLMSIHCDELEVVE